jgi:tetrapyrrole methylase family protein/MazG family protein
MILAMSEQFSRLIEIVDALLGPNGCPWDHKQTLSSLKEHLEEESAELFVEIDVNENNKILEELGDVFFVAFFMAKVAQKEGRFTLDEVLLNLNEKLIRRHPHVFGDAKVETIEELHEQWERIKLEEKRGK